MPDERSDPTLLTTQQLQRELQLLEERFNIRLAGMDKAQELFRDDLTRVPTQLDKEISHLKELYDEKFHSIGIQFEERDTRMEQNSKHSQDAVNAAFQSSNQAISKSEISFTKQIDQIGDRITQSSKSADDKFTDLKDRLTMLEGQKKGVADGWAILIGAVGLLATIGALITLFVTKN
jgi:hypothetical protein